MSERVFLDTNLFVYAEDADQPAKRSVAQRLIKQLVTEQRAVVSTQVLAEYAAAARRRLKLSYADCRRTLLLMSQLHVALIRPEHVLGATDLASLHALSFWDALIIRVASAAGCARLLTEDLQHGRVLEGVRIENPFRDA